MLGDTMALFDDTISLQTTLEDAWTAAQQTLTPAEKIVSSTPNAAFAAMDSVLGYLYIFRTRSNGDIAVRLLIDEAPRLREVFRAYKGAEALDMLVMLGSADTLFAERINHLGKQRLKHIEEFLMNDLKVDHLLEVGALTDKGNPKAESVASPESLAQPSPTPDWLTGLSSAIPPEGRTAVPKVIASPYAEPIVSDRRHLWWTVGIVSLVFVLGLLILVMLIGRFGADRNYDGQRFSLKLPSGWSKIAQDSRTEICSAGSTCPLVIGKDPYHFVALYFSIETSATSWTQTDIETKYWYTLNAQHSEYSFVNQHTEQLGARSTVVIEYLVPHQPDTYYLARHVILLNPTTTLHVVGYAISAFQYEETRQEIDQIIQTITIKP
jgi:hypothetical protein